MTHAYQLEVTTPTDLELVMTRMFDAPRRLVFECWTKPDLVSRWLTGPEGWHFVACDIDLRVGGSYRFVWRGPAGDNLAMGGIYREIAMPEMLVSTEKFDEDWSSGETSVTLQLTEDRKQTTTSVNTIAYLSKAARDGALAVGMTEGVAASYDRLDNVLDSLLATRGDGRSHYARHYN